MAFSYCKIEVVPFGQGFLRLFDYNCDGHISGDSLDRIEIESDRKIETQDVYQFFNRSGLDLSQRYAITTLADFFGNGRLGSLGNFISGFSPPFDLRRRNNPEFEFQAIEKTWRGKIAFETRTPEELVQRFYAKEEAVGLADRLANAGLSVVEEFLQAPYDEAPFKALEADKIINSGNLENHFVSAGLLYRSFGEEPISFISALERWRLYLEEIEYFHEEISARIKELFAEAEDIRGELNLRVGAWLQQGNFDPKEKVWKAKIHASNYWYAHHNQDETEKIEELKTKVQLFMEKFVAFKTDYPYLTETFETWLEEKEERFFPFLNHYQVIHETAEDPRIWDQCVIECDSEEWPDSCPSFWNTFTFGPLLVR